MELRAGVAFQDDGTVRSTDGYGPTESDSDYDYSEYYTENTTFFEADDPDNPEGLENISESDPPVATVNRRDKYVDEEVVIQTAIKLANYDGDVIWFENILEVENRAGGEQEFAIKYENHYGSDVKEGSTDFNQDLVPDDVQQVYKFWVKKDTGNYHISPDPGDSSEEPDEPAPLDPGETVQIDLEIDLSEWSNQYIGDVDPKQGIRNAQEDLGFTDGLDTVDMLDAIEIGKYTT
jgi:hypothetical protein